MTAGRAGLDISTIGTGAWSAYCKHPGCAWSADWQSATRKPGIIAAARRHARGRGHHVGLSAVLHQTVSPPAGAIVLGPGGLE